MFFVSMKGSELSKEECQIVYWMVESLGWKEEIKKEELDSVI